MCVWSLCCCCSVAQLCQTLCEPMDCSNTRLLCPSRSPRARSDSCPLSQRCHPSISSSVISFSFCLQSFLASVFSGSLKFGLRKLTFYCCCCSVAKFCLTLCDPMDRSTPGFCHFLLQGIFPTQGSNPGIAGRRFMVWATREAKKKKKKNESCSVVSDSL